jgi:hypothetical protein
MVLHKEGPFPICGGNLGYVSSGVLSERLYERQFGGKVSGISGDYGYKVPIGIRLTTKPVLVLAATIRAQGCDKIADGC